MSSTPATAHTVSAATNRGPGLPGLPFALRQIDAGRVPDVVIRWGIRRLVRAGLQHRATLSAEHAQREFTKLLDDLKRSPIALCTDKANEQHYELPPEFFALCLGPHRKYSGCYWPPGVTTLEQAEIASLRQTAVRADLSDGQEILELGCGWGSLTLWMAARYPNARITAVSNSRSQRAYVEARAAERQLRNVEVITADMNDFAPPDHLAGKYDRVVSVEMFEHMRNYEALLRRIAVWLKPGGKLFVHIFTHARTAYTYEDHGDADWMTRHFFTGGIMPSDHLLLYFQHELTLERHWRQSGTHYRNTANAWLANLDAHRERALPLLERAYGRRHGGKWLHRWRVFFMACAEMFGYAGGTEWGVSHYRFQKR